jgi:hypothetical protein
MLCINRMYPFPTLLYIRDLQLKNYTVNNDVIKELRVSHNYPF